ncbi:MAG TPA: GNAT family N-acetyltransferase [Planctomycetota bacterium]|nr:GNAT family N-acetyltransferase [Planctomycetota bacterium]
MELVDVTSDDGRVARPEWLARAETVHRELRDFREPYATVLARVFAGGGRMRVAVVDGEVAGVAVWRLYEKTHPGLQLYVDDLVTASGRRSTGVGAALLRSLEATARERGCILLELDSGTARKRAHAFYLRERMEIGAFHFVKPLVADVPRVRV